MKKLLLLALIFCTLNVLAQQKVKFAYDAAGNRVSRTIELSKKSASILDQGNEDNQTENSFFEEVLSERKVKLYPNPVKSHLMLEINGYQADLNGRLMVFDMSGRKLIDQQVVNSYTQLNMQTYPTGTYMMHIVLDGEKSTWKVVKQ